MILFEFDFKINYRKELQNGKVDAFSRRRDYIIDDKFNEKAILRQKEEQLVIAAIYKILQNDK